VKTRKELIPTPEFNYGPVIEFCWGSGENQTSEPSSIFFSTRKIEFSHFSIPAGVGRRWRTTVGWLGLVKDNIPLSEVSNSFNHSLKNPFGKSES